MKKNIVIITNGTLPVPPVNGGAVENLLQTFIDLNEKYKNFELVVFSIYNKIAYEKSKSYELSNFVFINTNTISYKCERFFRYLLNKLLGNKFKNQFIKKVLEFKKEFVNTDIEIGGDLTDELEDRAYYTLKEMAADKGYEMKGNPKKEDLINFLSEATE